MRLESLVAVYAPSLYETVKNEINNKQINMRGLCPNANRHKQ